MSREKAIRHLILPSIASAALKGASARRRGAVEQANWWTVTMSILVSPVALLLGPLG